ncbi:response regulator transcription factor [Pleionea sediminis]|uniref:response regulator transcription factor n=1 Tax=Pleionea sediminis TaxID=2569479 RepID=UPI001185BF1A|nr:response regulator transcription factor [Pleionea sediminis]
MKERASIYILLIEDQIDLCKNIAQFFEAQGYTLDFAHSGTSGLSLALENHYDVIILDLTLPGMDGLKVCENIRKNAEYRTPIIMLTARDALPDKIAGFEQGADDYLTKPFALEELHMRCLALTQRNQLHQPQTIHVGDLMIDTASKRAMRQNRPLNLTSMSYSILEILAQAHPKVVTRSELARKLWGDDPTESDSLRSHIYQLRQAVDKPFPEPIIKTIHGVGFSLAVEN